MGGGYRELSRANWQAYAGGWVHWSDQLDRDARKVTVWLLERLRPQPGQTLLELAAGRGDVGFEAARRLGDEGRLISTDFAATMVEYARSRGEALGVGNAEFRVVDAERIDLPDGSVHAVLCRWGYMLMGDAAAALRETRRVLRPGGRVAFATWGRPERNPWLGVLSAILVERGHMPAPVPGGPGVFTLGDPGLVRVLALEAGFGDVEVEEVPLALDYGDEEGHWDFLTTAAGAVAGILAALAEDERNEIRRENEERVRPLLTEAGYALPALSLNVVAR